MEVKRGGLLEEPKGLAKEVEQFLVQRGFNTVDVSSPYHLEGKDIYIAYRAERGKGEVSIDVLRGANVLYDRNAQSPSIKGLVFSKTPAENSYFSSNKERTSIPIISFNNVYAALSTQGDNVVGVTPGGLTENTAKRELNIILNELSRAYKPQNMSQEVLTPKVYRYMAG